MKKHLQIKFLLAILISIYSLQNMAQQWNGLTLIAIRSSYTMGVVDTNGTMVKTWTFTPAQGANGYPAYMTQGGYIWRTVIVSPVPPGTPQNGGTTGRIQKIDWAGNILWDWTFANAQGILHHDICLMPNGNVLATAYDVRTTADMINAGCTYTLPSIYSERIMEIQPVGTNSANIVWEWKLWDHLVQNANPLKNNYQTSIVNHPELMNINHGSPTADFIHMNGLDYYPLLDQIAFSSHIKAELYIIDHSSNTAGTATHSGGNSGMGGDLLYRWGTPSVYQAPGAAVIPSYAHDAHFIPDGVANQGDLVCFNNSGQASPFRSTIDRISLPRSGYTYTISLGNAFTPASFTSRYVCTAYSSGWSSAEQYPNGNQLIDLAPGGTVYECNAAGTTLWSYSTGGLTPQAHRYTPCFINFAPPAQPSIAVSGASLVCSPTAVTYQWYLNGNAIPSGTLQTYVPTASGVYLVRTTDINACAYYYSDPNYFTYSPLGFCNITKVLNSIEAFPNPSYGQLNINLNGIKGDFSTELRSTEGQLIMTEKNNLTLDLRHLESGIYFLKINTEKGNVTKKIVLVK